MPKLGIQEEPIGRIDCDNTILVNETEYRVIKSFIYRGTNTTTEIQQIQAIVRKSSDGTGTGKLRIYDVTHAKTICEATGITHEINTIVDLGTISNLPTTESVMEIQLAVTEVLTTICCDEILVHGGI